MNFQTQPLAKSLGIEVSGLSLTRIDTDTAARLYRLFVEHSVICFREQDLEPQAFLDAAQNFGEPIVQIYGQFNLQGFPQIGVLTSEDADTANNGERKIRGTSWHTDASYFERPPKATHSIVNTMT